MDWRTLKFSPRLYKTPPPEGFYWFLPEDDCPTREGPVRIDPNGAVWYIGSEIEELYGANKLTDGVYVPINVGYFR